MQTRTKRAHQPPPSAAAEDLPRAANDTQLDAATAGPRPLAGPWSDPTPAALIVDVDCSARRRLAADLQARGFAVEVADETEVGAERWRARRPALVVIELRLRAGAGLDLLARARAELPEAKLIVLTSYGSVASTVRAMRLGATDYLCKPATAAEVLNAAGLEAPASAAEAMRTSAPPAEGAMTRSLALDVPLTLDEAIWEYINRTVEAAGSLSEAARRLGIWRQSLKRMIAKYRPPPGAPPLSSASV